MSNDALTVLKERLLDRLVLVTIDDPHPRRFRGWFKGTDGDMNLILSGTTEICYDEGFKNVLRSRAIGMVVVPGRHIVQVHLSTPGYTG